MKKALSVLCALCGLLCFAGCAGNIEIERELIVEAVGVDKTGDGILLTVQALNAQTHAGGNQDTGENGVTAVFSARGKTVSEAAAALTLTTGKQPVFSQNRIILLGNSALRDGDVIPLLDMFLRSYQLRSDSYLAAAPSAEEIVRVRADSGSIPAVRLQQIIETGAKAAACVPVRLYEFYNMYEDGTVGSMPVFHLNADRQPELSGEAVFRRGVRVGFLDAEESRILSLLTEKAHDGAITAEFENRLYSFRILSAKPRLRRSGTILTVRCLCDTAEIIGAGGVGAAQAQPAAEAAEKMLREKALALLEKLRGYGAFRPGLAPGDPSDVAFEIRLKR